MSVFPWKNIGKLFMIYIKVSVPLEQYREIIYDLYLSECFRGTI